MASLHSRKPKDSFKELLKINKTGGVDSSLSVIEDGQGVATPLKLSTTQVAIHDMIWPASGAANGKILGIDSNGQLQWTTLPVVEPDKRYDLSFSSNGIAPAGKVFLFAVPRAFTLPQNFSGSVARSLVAPSASTAFKIYKVPASNVAQHIGTMTFGSGSRSATFSGTAASFAVGDILYVDLESADSSLSDVAVTLLATLV